MKRIATLMNKYAFLAYPIFYYGVLSWKFDKTVLNIIVKPQLIMEFIGLNEHCSLCASRV